LPEPGLSEPDCHTSRRRRPATPSTDHAPSPPRPSDLSTTSPPNGKPPSRPHDTNQPGLQTRTSRCFLPSAKKFGLMNPRSRSRSPKVQASLNPTPLLSLPVGLKTAPPEASAKKFGSRAARFRSRSPKVVDSPDPHPLDFLPRWVTKLGIGSRFTQLRPPGQKWPFLVEVGIIRVRRRPGSPRRGTRCLRLRSRLGCGQPRSG